MSEEDDDFIIANPHVFEVYTFAVPPGEPYTDIDRMFMMFDLELWIAIGVTLAGALAITLTLHLVSKKIRDLIVGDNIQSPTMNLITIFLTGSQVKTPKGNFSRFLVNLFIIWSLIIRTCHQSMLFQLLQADLRKPPLKTIDELFGSALTMHDTVNEENSSIVSDKYFWQRLKMTSTRYV